MKILYITCILFAFFAQSVVSTSKDYQKLNVDYFNRARNQFAANLPVANMNELEYDEALEKTFSSCQTAQKEAENDNRVIMFRSDSVTEISFDREGEAQKLVNDNHVNALLYKLIFHSQITSVGCVQLDMECAYPGPGHNTPDVWRTTGMCFFDGPENAKIPDNFKRGKPATQCPNGRSEKYKNLCKTSKSSSGSLVSPAHILIAAVFIMITFYF